VYKRRRNCGAHGDSNCDDQHLFHDGLLIKEFDTIKTGIGAELIRRAKTNR
jgi:hypothetical protein